MGLIIEIPQDFDIDHKSPHYNLWEKQDYFDLLSAKSALTNW